MAIATEERVMTERSIDGIRNSAFHIEVGLDDDRSPIREMFVIDGEMHVIKSQGIYRVQLADQIDPGRTNSAIPNTFQRVLRYGADSDLVRRTLLTAKRLFGGNAPHLGQSFPYARAISLSLEALKDIVAMDEMHLSLASELKAVEAALGEQPSEAHAPAIPTIDGIRASVETYLQKADHAVSDLFDIAKLFYPGVIGKKWFESLLVLSEQKYGRDANFTKFISDTLPVLKLVRNARNSVEHPDQVKHVCVFDIILLPSGHLRPPTLEVVHPETPLPLTVVSEFMEQMVEQVSGIFELMLAFLCGYNVQPFAGCDVQVMRYAPDQEKAFGVRYGYGIPYGDQVVPLG